jgi:formyltetrahydrofolate-dependent phosphoribosylglycinamide formyltransferase
MSRCARLVVLISGSGTNLQAILDACESGALDARVVAVVSNRKAAFGLERATQAHVPTIYLPLKPYTDAGRPREEYDKVLADRVAALRPDLVVLAGWMHVFTPAFYECFRGPVINLHPALPGQFPGVHSIQRAFEAFQRGEIPHGGVLVHRAVPEVDAGQVITQEVVPILPTDTLDGFEARVHETEHRLLVEAIRILLESQLGGEPNGDTASPAECP